jgi:putative ABC transport system substrate-binding protein
MRRRNLPRLVIAAALALGASHALAETGVCVAVSPGELGAVADAVQRSLGVASRRIDVGDRRERDQLASRCGRLVVAVGAEALRVASEEAPRAPTLHVMAPRAQAGASGGVLSDAEPRRVFETLRKIAPRVRRVGVVFDPARTGPLVAEADAAARALGLELVALPAHGVGEAVRAFHRFEDEVRVDALWLLPDGTATVQETVYYALELAHWRRMAVVGLSRWYVASGALFALVPRPESCGAAAGELGQQLLRGGQPPGAVYGCEYSLYVNQRTATQLGLELPRKLLEGAAQVLP